MRLSPNLRALFLVVLGLGLIYKVGVSRGVIPSIAQLQQLGGPPIVCPPDEKIHTPPLTFIKTDQALAKLLPGGFDRTKVSVLIEKSQYRLTVFYNQKPLKSYPVVFGDGEGDKRREGDRKTPEGILRIRDKYPHESWAKFLWLDYPNPQSECKHNRAKQRREIPAASTIGGEVGIHGVAIGDDLLVETKMNWTWGCPSLRRQDVDELYEVVQIGTVVEIIG
jgi:murein L,D-transpeptidase YafK